MARRKKKLNRRLLIAFCVLGAVGILGAGALLAHRYLPRNPERLYAEARQAVEEGDSYTAVGKYRAAIRWTRGDLELGHQYRMEFVDCLEHWLQTDEGLSVERSRGIRAEWIRQLEAVLRDDPRNLTARSRLTDFYWEASMRGGARHPELLETFLQTAGAQARLTPDDAEVHHRMARVYADLSRGNRDYYPKALECFALAVRAAPDESRYYTNWVSFLIQQEDVRNRPDSLEPAGVTPMETILEHIDDLAQARLESKPTPGWVQNALERLTPGDVYRLGLAARPDAVQLRVALAEYLFFAQDPAAEEHFQRAAAVEPKQPRDLLALANYCRQTASPVSDRADQALEYYALARQADPELLEASVGQVQLHLMRREFSEAEEVSREALDTLATIRAGQYLTTLAVEDVSHLMSAAVHLNVSLAEALIGALPQAPEQRRDTLAEIRRRLAAAKENNLPDIEDQGGVRRGQVGVLQRRTAKVRARLALLDGDEFEAERLYRLAYEGSQTLDVEVASVLVNLYLKHGQESEAVRLLRQLTRAFPQEANPWLLLGRVYLAQRNMTGLSEAISRAQGLELDEAQVARLVELQARYNVLSVQLGAGRAPGDMPDQIAEVEVPQWLAYAQRLLDGEEPEQAKAVVLKLQAQFPANQAIVAALVQMHLAAGDSEEALAVLDEALTIRPDSQRLKFLREVVNAPPEQRDDVYMTYVKEHEDGVQRELMLAALHQRRDNPAKYYEHMENAVAMDPRAENSLERLFTAYLADGRIEDAERLAGKAAEIGPRGLQGTKGKVFDAQILLVQERWDEAIAELQEAVAMRPQFDQAHALLGQAYLGAGRLAEAQTSFEASYSLSSNEVRTLVGLARVAEAQGRTDDHRRWIMAAHPHAPMIPYVRHNWLRYRRDNVSPEQFLRDCVSLYRRYPSDMDLVLTLASAYEGLARPDYAKAEEIYRKAYDHHKGTEQESRFLAQLVEFLQRAGKMAEAETVLNETPEVGATGFTRDLLKIQLLMSADRYDEARTLIDAACKQHPEDTRPFLLLAQWVLTTNVDWSAAVQALETVLELKPDDPVHWQQYCEILMRAGQYDRLIQQLERRLARAPNDHETIALMAHAYQILGRTDDAMEMCEKAIAINPNQIRARAIRSDILFARGEVEASILDIERAYADRPTETLALLLANRLYEAYPNQPRAKAVLTAALAERRDSVPLLRRLGEINLETRNWRELDEVIAQGRRASPRIAVWSLMEAEKWKALGRGDRRAAALKAAHNLDPSSMSVTTEYIDALLEIGQYDQVLAVIADARAPTREAAAQLQAAAGRANFLMGNREQGLRDLQTALATGGRMPTIALVARHFFAAVGDDAGVQMLTQWTETQALPGPRMALAMKLIEQGRMDAAATALAGADLTAASIEQKLYVHRTLGGLQYRLGRFAEARASYEQALELAQDATMLNNMAYMLAEDLGEPEAALPYAKEAVRLNPTDPNIADTLGWVYFQVGNIAEAETQLKRSIDLRRTPAALYHLGRVYESQDQLVDAREMYQLGFDLVRDNPDDAFHDLLREQVQR